MNSIAVIGTQGAGKTVFITTLAHRLSAETGSDLLLKPGNSATFRYIENNWHRLTRGEWPKPTDPGVNVDLRWQLEVDDQPQADLRLFDLPGHDLRLIFAEEGGLSVDTLPEALRPVIDYCRKAKVVLLLLRLDDYIERTDESEPRHIENQAVLLSSLNFVRSNQRSCALVFTQADQSADYVGMQPEKTLQHRWLASAAEHMPVVFRAHLAKGDVPVFPVACVNDTEVRVDEQGARRVPKRRFNSKGLAELVLWLRVALEQADPIVENPPDPDGTPRLDEAKENPTDNDWVQAALIAALPSAILATFCGAASLSSAGGMYLHTLEGIWPFRHEVVTFNSNGVIDALFLGGLTFVVFMTIITPVVKYFRKGSR